MQAATKRKIRGEPFPEEELNTILDNLTKAVRELYFVGIKHGCLNLSTVLYPQATPILTDVSSTTYLINYELTLKGDR